MIKNCPMRHENGNCIPAGGFCTANKNICEALLNAYKMGKAQLSKEGTTKDAISRQQALDIFDDYNVSVEYGELEAYSRDRKRLCELPTIQPEVLACGNGELIAQPELQEGHWIEGKIYRDVIECYCSECGQLMTTAATVRMNYCPNCGARMVKGERQK